MTYCALYCSVAIIIIHADESNLRDLTTALWTIRSSYYSFGQSLNLERTGLQVIHDRYPKESDAELALEDVLLLWLKRKYNVEKHGQPTWRMVIKAVNEMCNGSYHELAKKMASNHQTGRPFMLHTVYIVEKFGEVFMNSPIQIIACMPMVLRIQITKFKSNREPIHQI